MKSADQEQEQSRGGEAAVGRSPKWCRWPTVFAGVGSASHDKSNGGGGSTNSGSDRPIESGYNTGGYRAGRDFSQLRPPRVKSKVDVVYR